MTTTTTNPPAQPDDARKAFYAAFTKAQAEMPNPGLDGSNGHFKSKFTPLPAVIKAAKEALSQHGLSFFQPVGMAINDGKVFASVTTILSHEGGHSETFGPTLFPVDKGNAHAMGSAITYARRYALCSVLGIAGDEDDDGNAASGMGQQQQRNGSTQRRAPSGAPDERDLEMLNAYKLELDQAASQAELMAIAGNWKDRLPSRVMDDARAAWAARNQALAAKEAVGA